MRRHLAHGNVWVLGLLLGGHEMRLLVIGELGLLLGGMHQLGLVGYHHVMLRGCVGRQRTPYAETLVRGAHFSIDGLVRSTLDSSSSNRVPQTVLLDTLLLKTVLLLLDILLIRGVQLPYNLLGIAHHVTAIDLNLMLLLVNWVLDEVPNLLSDKGLVDDLRFRFGYPCQSLAVTCQSLPVVVVY